MFCLYVPYFDILTSSYAMGYISTDFGVPPAVTTLCRLEYGGRGSVLFRECTLFGCSFRSFFGRPYYRSSLWYSISSVCLSVCLSVVCRLSVTFCIVAKRCVLAKKCLKE